MTAQAALSRNQVICAILLSAAFLAVSMGGGMLYDRVNLAPDFSGPIGLVGFPLSAALSLVGLGVAVWFDRAPWRVGLTSTAFVALVAISALSIAESPYLHASLVSFAILTSAVAFGWSLERAALPRDALLGVAAVLVTAASIVAGMGLSEYLTHIARPPRDFSWRVFSTFAAPNFLAGYLVMTVPVTAAGLFAAIDRKIKLLMGFGLVIQITCLFLTGSRFGLASLFIAGVVFTWLAARKGLISRFTARGMRILGVILVLLTVLGSATIGRRLFRSGAESYSNLFRLYTWRGTARMAAAHPILGTGLGSFDSAYGPYAEVAYTQHAHNTYLQLAAECGFPALAAFLAAIGSILISVTRAARRTSNGISDDLAVDATIKARSREKPDARLPVPTPVWSELGPGFLAAGAVSGIAGALARNLFDSDLYVPANATTFAALLGLAVSISRLNNATIGAESAAAASRPSPRRVLAVLGAAFAIVCLGAYTAGRLAARAAESEMVLGDGEAALRAMRVAARMDPLNPEYRLRVAGLLASSGQGGDAEAAFRSAAAVAELGKSRYQYGRFLAAAGRWEDAAREFERASTAEPNNLQNALALAESYSKLGMEDRAEAAYRRVIDLYNSPFGRIRALPELIDYEFAEAYRALAELELKKGDREAAEPDLRRAVAILEQYWSRRKNPMVQIQVRPEKALMVGELYAKAITSLADLARDRGERSQATELEARLTALRSELEQDREALKPQD